MNDNKKRIRRILIDLKEYFWSCSHRSYKENTNGVSDNGIIIRKCLYNFLISGWSKAKINRIINLGNTDRKVE